MGYVHLKLFGRLQVASPSLDAVGIKSETPKSSSGVENGGELSLSQLTSGRGEHRKIPVGSRVEPRLKLNFVKSECQRSHLVAHISMYV